MSIGFLSVFVGIINPEDSEVFARFLMVDAV
jgi:hypothetical protein